MRPSGAPARLRALSLPGEAGPESPSFWVSGRSLPPFQALCGPRCHIRRPSEFTSARSHPCGGLRKKPRPRSLPASKHRSRRAAVTLRCLTFLQTIRNIIKSFPNHAQRLSNSKIKGEQIHSFRSDLREEAVFFDVSS